MAAFETYKNKYSGVRLERRDGILEIALHTDGGPAKWSAHVGGLHDELGDVFYQVGHDMDNKVVILTGTGEHFLIEFDWSKKIEDYGTPQYWDRMYREGRDLMENLLDIPMPIIGAVNGPAFIHAELVAMSDIVIASDTAIFADKAHAPRGTMPGDGGNIWWPLLLGLNRGRHFLWTGAEIPAEEAQRIGVVAEVVPLDQLRARAWEIAADLATKSPMMLRYTRTTFTQSLKRRMVDELGHSMAMEGMAALGVVAAQGYNPGPKID